MQVLAARPQDLQKIAPLFDQYRQFYKQASDPEACFAFLNERLARHESVIFWAQDGDRAAGFAQLYPSFSSVSLKALWILNDLFVTPEFRGQKAGHALMQACEDFAREQGARGIMLKTAIDNFPAQKLYESRGWKKDEKFFSYGLFF